MHPLRTPTPADAFTGALAAQGRACTAARMALNVFCLEPSDTNFQRVIAALEQVEATSAALEQARIAFRSGAFVRPADRHRPSRGARGGRGDLRRLARGATGLPGVSAAMTIKPILKYPGAKWRLAPWLHRHAPRCHHVVEPYCGSAAFSLSLPYQPRHLVLNDIADDVIALFQTIRDHEAELARVVTLTAWSRAEYEAVTNRDATIIRTGDPVEDARRYLIASWQQHGSKTSRRGGWRHQGAAGRSSTYDLWLQLPERIAVVADRLRSAEIESLPALTIIGRYATADTLLYVDPPYVLTTRKNEKRYRHEMTDADHADLLTALEAHPGPVLLSGYRSALYDTRLAHWTRVETAAVAEKGRTVVECLWLNAAALPSIPLEQLTLEYDA